ncbi:hypothetical protein GCM10027299_31690 [Larkinella ripae]
MAQQPSKAIQQLHQKAQLLKEAFEKAQSHRYYWEKKTKPLLDRVLNEIKNETALVCTYQEVSPESVRFTISDEQGKEAGVLTFILMHDSRVAIDMSYYLRAYHPERNVQNFFNLNNLEPGLVDEDLIYTSVTRFLDVILADYSAKPVTFKNLTTQPDRQYIRMSAPGK